MVDEVNDDFSEEQFIKIKEAEIKKKFSEVAIQKGHVKVWKSGEGKALDSVLESVDGSEEELPIKVTLSMKAKVEEGSLKNQELFIYFTIKKSKFFSKGTVESVEGEGTVKLVLENDLYKLDQRKSKRISTFPGHRVYSYLKIQEGNKGEVIHLNRPKDHLHNFFKSFQKQVLNSQFNDSSPLEKDFMDDYIGFRVLDLSNDGLSFLLNHIEADYFKKLTASFKMILNFNGKEDTIEGCSISYLIPYINPSLGNLSLFKLGLSFKKIDGLIDRPVAEDQESGAELARFASFMK